MSKEIIESNIQHSQKRIEELNKIGTDLQNKKAEGERNIDGLYGDYNRMHRDYDSWEKEVWSEEDNLEKVKENIADNDRKIRINKRALDGLKAIQGK